MSESNQFDFERFYSSMIKNLASSGIGEVIRLAEEEGDVIQFTSGQPHPDSFPINTIANLSKETVKEFGNEMLQYGNTMGAKKLRKLIAERYRDRFEVEINYENVMITTGSLQAIYLISNTFLSEQERIIVEAPTYSLALNSFRPRDPQFISIPVDNEGLKVKDLKQKLKEVGSPQFLYTIPTFQNPTGVTMTSQRRKEIIGLASKYDFLIVEDSPYNELRYRGQPKDPLFSFDEEGRTFHVSTFSKTFAPGMRIGWIIADKEGLLTLAKLKSPIDTCTSPFCQYITYQYVKTDVMDNQIPKLRKMYRRKQKHMLDALNKYMPEKVEWTCPNGGMFLWVTLPEDINANKMINDAINNKVAYVPGSAFYIQKPEPNTMRLNFTSIDDEEIPIGIQRLSEVVKNYL